MKEQEERRKEVLTAGAETRRVLDLLTNSIGAIITGLFTYPVLVRMAVEG